MPSPLPDSGARARIYRAALRLYAENGGQDVTVRELAEAAGIARGTIYNNIEDPEALFGEIARALSHEMIARVEATMDGLDDPVARLATGMRLFVRRAHEDQDWGRFIIRFGLGDAALRNLVHEPPVRDVAQAIETGRFKVEPARAPVLVSMLTGATLTTMDAVIRGEQAWRDAASGAAELFLRAGGVAAAEARRIARTELPPLAPVKPARAERTRKP